MTEPTTKALSLVTREKISLSKTKYTKEYLATAGVEYINEIITAQATEKKLPTITGYCLHAGVSRSRLYELTKEYTEVADIVEYIQLMQEEAALQGGATNKLNPIFSMFLLKSKHEYKDQPQQLTQNNSFNISPDLLADALAIIRQPKKSGTKE